MKYICARLALKKYDDIRIPNFEVGCKQRILNSGYLEGLYKKKNITLTRSSALDITADGIRTKNGLVEADVIVLANRFVMNHLLNKIDINLFNLIKTRTKPDSP